MLDFWAQTVKPQDNIKLLIIGEGPSKEELEQQAVELGIGDQVHFAGKILHDKLPPLLRGVRSLHHHFPLRHQFDLDARRNGGRPAGPAHPGCAQQGPGG